MDTQLPGTCEGVRCPDSERQTEVRDFAIHCPAVSSLKKLSSVKLRRAGSHPTGLLGPCMRKPAQLHAGLSAPALRALGS